MADSASERKSWQQYDITVLRAAAPYDGQGWSGYQNNNADALIADPNCIALWRFESGALEVDSKGSNTLTNQGDGATANAVNFVEGASSAFFDLDEPNQHYLDIADDDLDAGFPLKNGDTGKTFTICFWIKKDSMPTDGQEHDCVWKSGFHKFSLLIFVSNVGGLISIRLSIATDGDTYVHYYHASVLSIDTWYHVAVTYQVSDGAYRIRIFDNTAEAVLGVDKTGLAGTINASTGKFYIGSPTTLVNIGGKLDELIVFDKVTMDMVKVTKSN